MTTCRCCGQPLPVSGLPQIPVDDLLHDVCERARELAVANAAPEITVAQFVHAAATDQRLRHLFAFFDLDPARLARVTSAYCAASRQDRSGIGCSMSAEFSRLLSRSWHAAQARRSTAVAVTDMMSTLLAQCGDLSSAAMVAQWCSFASTRAASASHRTAISGGSAGGLSVEFAWQSAAVAQPPAQLTELPRPSSHRAAASNSTHLLERIAESLARQELYLAEMQTHRSNAKDNLPATGAQPAVKDRCGAVTTSGPTSTLSRWRVRSESWRQRSRPAKHPQQGPEFIERHRSPSRPLGQRSANDSTDARIAKARGAREHAYTDEDGEDAAAGPDVKRFYLCLDDEIVKAPSIGPRTAERLVPLGIVKVRHLLAADASYLAARLGARHLNRMRIAAWQDQARLVCTVPWLRGTHAQLLVGAGYESVEKTLAADRSVVCAAILKFAVTKDGQSILRAGPPPDAERIFSWIEHVQMAELERAG